MSRDLLSVTGSGPAGRIILRDLDNAKILPSDTAARAQFLPRANRRPPQPMQFHESVRAPLIITAECDMDSLMAAREQANRSAAQASSSATPHHITINDCLVKAIALAARARTGKSVTVGIALGSASAPIVVENVCTLPMPQLSDAICSARAGAHRNNENQDGDHADVLVANFGAFGARDAEFPASQRYPIVLSLGAARQAAVVRHGQLAIATVLHATLCVGEGVLEAATAGAMLAAFRGFVENPAVLFD